VLKRGFPSLPKFNPLVVNPRDNSQPYGFRIEPRVPQKAPDVPRSVVGLHIEQDQTIRWMR
jgi:hypothetical protein